MAEQSKTDLLKHLPLSAEEQRIVNHVYAFTENYFQNPVFDASHDFNHVTRVLKNAIVIFHQEQKNLSLNLTSIEAPLDALTVVLAALLHDVEDRKYVRLEEGSPSPIQQVLSEVGLPDKYILTIQELIAGISYSSEIKDPAHVLKLIKDIPELAIVQDADRLDSIGAIGVGRCFAYGGAKSARSLQDSISHFEDKLVRLEGMMKTRTGRLMAAERSKRIHEFMSWWEQESL